MHNTCASSSHQNASMGERGGYKAPPLAKKLLVLVAAWRRKVRFLYRYDIWFINHTPGQVITQIGFHGGGWGEGEGEEGRSWVEKVGDLGAAV